MSGKAFTGVVYLGFWMFDVSGKVIYRCCILGFLDVWPTFRLVRCVMYLGFWMFEVSDKVSYRCYLRRFLDFKAVWSFRYCQLSHLSFVYLRVSLCVSVSVIVVLVVLTALYFSVQHHCLRSGSATLCVQQHLIQIQDNSEILHQSLGVSIQQTVFQLCFLLLLLFKIVSVLGFTFLHKLSKPV